jgi:hypothetical protein
MAAIIDWLGIKMLKAFAFANPTDDVLNGDPFQGGETNHEVLINIPERHGMKKHAKFQL